MVEGFAAVTPGLLDDPHNLMLGVVEGLEVWGFGLGVWGVGFGVGG
jgi:hypothetical protein